MNSYERENVIQALANIDEITEFFLELDMAGNESPFPHRKSVEKAKECLETALGIIKK